MAVGSCEEATATLTPTEVLDQVQASLTKLEKAFRGQKPGKAGAQVWADAMDQEINKALCLLKIREQYPGREYPQLKTIFAELDASIQRADEELFRYGTKIKLPHYV